MGKVRWEKVPLHLPSNKPSGQMADALFAQTVMGGEYQLFWNSQEEMRLWGSMPADLIALSETDGRVVIIENKVGSGFTGVRDDPGAGQLAKQVDFLLNCKLPNRALVLLSTTELFNRGWYRNELLNTLRHAERETKVRGFLMCWEDVLLAVT